MMMTRVFGGHAVQMIDAPADRAYRLTAKVLEAFNLACDLDDLETAEVMLKAADDVMTREGVPAFRQWGAAQSLVDAHFRLCEMRCSDR